MPEQYLSTSRLVNVIQLIALGKQTGVLKVIRGQGSTREQAEIHFAQGRPTYAMLGQLVGNAALSVLQNWGESQYAFLEGQLPQREQGGSATEQPGVQNPFAPGAYGARRTAPQGAAIPPAPPTPFPIRTGPVSLPPISDPRTPNPGVAKSFFGRRENQFPPGPAPTPPTPRDSLQGEYVPRRLASMDRLDSLPLDRRERMVLLLIDGRRSIGDLVRLTRRNQDELQHVLGHLASLGLIE